MASTTFSFTGEDTLGPRCGTIRFEDRNVDTPTMIVSTAQGWLF